MKTFHEPDELRGLHEQEMISRLSKDIEFLSSPHCRGRLSGTNGAFRAAQYLAEKLKSSGYSPMGEDGYFSYVNVEAKRLEGPVSLIIGTRELRYRKDFAEITRFSAGGKFTGELMVVRDGEQIRPELLKGKAVLIPELPEEFDLSATVTAAEELGVELLLIEYGEPSWFHKTLYGFKHHRIPVMRICSSVAKELINYQGQTVTTELPLETGILRCRNIQGILLGSNKEQTVVLTAHYDHLGDDPGGNRFPGAQDNASGVAAILETARQYARTETHLPFNILVVFLTGEESGMVGARQLVSNPPVHISAVINIDCIGSEPVLHAMRIGHKEPGDTGLLT